MSYQVWVVDLKELILIILWRHALYCDLSFYHADLKEMTIYYNLDRLINRKDTTLIQYIPNPFICLNGHSSCILLPGTCYLELSPVWLSHNIYAHGCTILFFTDHIRVWLVFMAHNQALWMEEWERGRLTGGDHSLWYWVSGEKEHQGTVRQW